MELLILCCGIAVIIIVVMGIYHRKDIWWGLTVKPQSFTGEMLEKLGDISNQIKVWQEDKHRIERLEKELIDTRKRLVEASEFGVTTSRFVVHLNEELQRQIKMLGDEFDEKISRL